MKATQATTRQVLAQIEQEAQEDVLRYEELQRSMQELEAWPLEPCLLLEGHRCQHIKAFLILSYSIVM